MMHTTWIKYWGLGVLLWVGLFPFLSAQWDQDLDLVANHVESQPLVEDYRHEAPFRWSWNPALLLIRTGLFVYQQEITYQMGSTCMYSPSCSEFSRQSFQTFGPVKGLFLSIDRLTRCNRLARPRHGEFEFQDDHFLDTPKEYHLHKEL